MHKRKIFPIKKNQCELNYPKNLTGVVDLPQILHYIQELKYWEGSRLFNISIHLDAEITVRGFNDMYYSRWIRNFIQLQWGTNITLQDQEIYTAEKVPWIQKTTFRFQGLFFEDSYQDLKSYRTWWRTELAERDKYDISLYKTRIFPTEGLVTLFEPANDRKGDNYDIAHANRIWLIENIQNWEDARKKNFSWTLSWF